MAQDRTNNNARKERMVVNWLWIIAAGSCVAGFMLRTLSSVLARADLRITGIALIAIGLAIAVLGWVGERIITRRANS
jgi:hypothetical protein